MMRQHWRQSLRCPTPAYTHRRQQRDVREQRAAASVCLAAPRQSCRTVSLRAEPWGAAAIQQTSQWRPGRLTRERQAAAAPVSCCSAAARGGGGGGPHASAVDACTAVTGGDFPGPPDQVACADHPSGTCMAATQAAVRVRSPHRSGPRPAAESEWCKRLQEGGAGHWRGMAAGPERTDLLKSQAGGSNWWTYWLKVASKPASTQTPSTGSSPHQAFRSASELHRKYVVSTGSCGSTVAVTALLSRTCGDRSADPTDRRAPRPPLSGDRSAGASAVSGRSRSE